MAGEVIDTVIILAEHLTNRLQLMGESTLTDTKNRFLGVVDYIFNRCSGLEGQARNLVRGFE